MQKTKSSVKQTWTLCYSDFKKPMLIHQFPKSFPVNLLVQTNEYKWSCPLSPQPLQYAETDICLPLTHSVSHFLLSSKIEMCKKTNGVKPNKHWSYCLCTLWETWSMSCSILIDCGWCKKLPLDLCGGLLQQIILIASFSNSTVICSCSGKSNSPFPPPARWTTAAFPMFDKLPSPCPFRSHYC